MQRKLRLSKLEDAKKLTKKQTGKVIKTSLTTGKKVQKFDNFQK